MQGGLDLTRISQRHGRDWRGASGEILRRCHVNGIYTDPWLHVGVDIGGTTPGDVVKAAFPGTVRLYYDAGLGWARGVVVENDARTMTATYIHIESDLREGHRVKRGDQIGTIANITADHLHFGLRSAPYRSDARRGALPPPGCNEPGFPNFPEHFFNPLTLKYDRW